MGMEEKISENLQGVFSDVIDDRTKYYHDNPNKKPSKRDIDGIISSYSNQNATISAGAGLVPGPWGMAAAVPEIILVLRNQIKMVYEIGVANGQEKVLKPEVLMYIVSSALGHAGAAFAAIQGSKLVVKRASLQVVQQFIKKLGGTITQKLLKSMASKWIPLAGAVAMGIWSKVSTNTIGKKANELFQSEIIYEDYETVNTNIIKPVAQIIEPKVEVIVEMDSPDIEYAKCLFFISLVRIDGKIEPQEIEMFTNLISHLSLSDEQKLDLMRKLESKETINLNYDLFKDNPADSIALMIDLIALAKVDNHFAGVEKMYIKQLGSKFNLPESDIIEMFD